LLDHVRQGDVLGNVLDFFGETRATVIAESDGVVIMVRRLPRVHVGDGLVQVTHTLDSYLKRQS
jgi:hypothetical protein